MQDWLYDAELMFDDKAHLRTRAGLMCALKVQLSSRMWPQHCLFVCLLADSRPV